MTLVRIYVHPELEIELKKIQNRLQEQVNENNSFVNVSTTAASRIAAKILRDRKAEIIVKSIFKKSGRPKFEL